MKTENDIRVVVIGHLDDEQSIEPINEKLNEYKIRLNEQLKTIPELYSQDDDPDSEYIDGFRMKSRFIKSNHLLSFTKEQDRLIEITEPTRRQSYIDIHKHYPIGSFDLWILSARLEHESMSVDNWWRAYKTLTAPSKMNSKEEQIQLCCAPAFNLPLPKQIARQAACLIKFYEMFKASVFLSDRSSSSTSFLSSISHIIPAIQLSFRPKILQWFDERIHNHQRLKYLLDSNCLCLVACGSKKTTFRYDFSLIELKIFNQFNTSECQLNIFVKRFAVKYLNCSLDNSFLRTSILWICEIHDLENYHNIFEVWVSFMRDVCRKRYLAHYFLENTNIFEEYAGLEDTISTLNYKNIDLFIDKLEENLIFPYVYQYNERMKNLLEFFNNLPVIAVKMKTIYNVIVKSQFPRANNSLHEICSLLCHLSFLEDDDKDHIISFWDQQWRKLFIDFDRDDIVLQQRLVDYRPNQLAQHMTESVLKLIQIDLIQMINLIKSNM
ncbi:unnamed protein product [Rotaria socialis]|uniref:Uncharacterized protein n=1 Tax=Rotaria socialis TaxID=392032 RepID=A0A820NSX1_9BILA|nr:unnamed protein product [Rotaria socialis]CAF3179843.1 unnamed protein product [Rotaria socialis]CAF3323681.1 unnamed protein product [Rotaria socialis]CAF3650164.1 unnamed protein product [Rotaria socialis]CAF4277116.1 unnamed protein product [Rotaria socialis]